MSLADGGIVVLFEQRVDLAVDGVALEAVRDHDLGAF